MTNYIMTNKLSQKIVIFFVLVCCGGMVKAHEFWLEPEKYQLLLEDSIVLSLKVGQNFKGESLIYNPSNFLTFQTSAIINGDLKTRAVKSRLGDIPAMKQKAQAAGLNIIAYVSSANSLTYDKAEKFTDFLKNEGLDWVLAAHKKRKLPAQGFNEVFHRYAKALIAVGEGKGKDVRLALPFEWVLLDNPYTTQGEIKAQLLFSGKPFSNAATTLFIRQKDKLVKSYLKTNEQGIVSIPRDVFGVYLLNAVHMIEATHEMEMESEAVWESLWASTTFGVSQ